MTDIQAGAVRYQVTDVDRAVAFYIQAFGFSEVMRPGPAFASIAKDGLTLWLSGPDSSGARPLPGGIRQQPGGSNRIVLQVSDLESCVASLGARGVSFRNSIESGPGGRQIQVEDPDGNPVELFEPAEGSMSPTATGGGSTCSSGGQAPRSSRDDETAIIE
jgi:glyoxylase I family protein